jgi:hypothetical protein
MGYTQHWYRPVVIADDVFRAIRLDFQKLILPMADIGVNLAGPCGRNEPEVNDECIAFNGPDHCGHPKNEEIFVPYPTDDARGLGPGETAIDESANGLVTKIKHRCCSGRCSHESFLFPKAAGPGHEPVEDDRDTKGLTFYWTKTAFKPYDIAVTAALLIAKRYLHNQLVIHSDGLDTQWADAKELCQRHLGYGDWFGIVEDPIIDLWPGPNGTQVEREVRLRILVEMDPAAFRL